eukprot:Em0004g120a
MGCSSIVDPRSAPTTTTVPAATDSIYTTTPNVVLRPGDPLTVSVNVVSLPNAPLDLYILMDLSDSMAAPLATVKSISQLIAQQVSSITTNVRIGFGAFNDKPIYPYSPQTPAGLPGRDAPDCSDRSAPPLDAGQGLNGSEAFLGSGLNGSEAFPRLRVEWK